MDDHLQFAFEARNDELHKIKVIGLGGGGGNAVNNMVQAGVEGPVFVVANSDLQALGRSLAPHRIQIGTQRTKGMGCGGKPEVGRESALEDIDKIREVLGESDMVFITAGMGGGTGSGSAPVVAEALSRLTHPPLVVGVVTKPFEFEGKRRMSQALEAIEELTKHCDSIITVPNEKLLALQPKGGRLTSANAYRMADEMLQKAVQSITDLIINDGLINADFEDLKSVMSFKGPTIMGVGQGSGEERAITAVRQAISSPLLDDLSIKGAKGLLLNISGPEDMGLDEVACICNFIQAEIDEHAQFIYGQVFDPSLAEEGLMKVTVIATGLGQTEEEVVELPPVQEVKDEGPSADAVRNAKYRAERERARLTVTGGLPGSAQSGGSLGSARTMRATRYETSFDEGVLDQPTYLRVKAD